MEYISDWTTRLRARGIVDVTSIQERRAKCMKLFNQLYYLMCVKQLSQRTTSNPKKQLKRLGAFWFGGPVLNYDGVRIEVKNFSVQQIWTLENQLADYSTAEMMLLVLQYASDLRLARIKFHDR